MKHCIKDLILKASVRSSKKTVDLTTPDGQTAADRMTRAQWLFFIFKHTFHSLWDSLHRAPEQQAHKLRTNHTVISYTEVGEKFSAGSCEIKGAWDIKLETKWHHFHHATATTRVDFSSSDGAHWVLQPENLNKPTLQVPLQPSLHSPSLTAETAINMQASVQQGHQWDKELWSIHHSQSVSFPVTVSCFTIISTSCISIANARKTF